MQNIYITGASGFVGSNLLNYLSGSKFNLHELSLRKPYNVQSIENADSIIHLAGKAHDLKNISQPEEYYHVNFDLTKKLYDQFLSSDAKKFIFISSVKAAADRVEGILTEQDVPAPLTHYGKSKLMAEEYIMNQPLPQGKSFYILRPCMIHGPGNKGNLNLLYKFVSKGIPWPLGGIDNRRSFLTVENLCFVIKQLLYNNDIAAGVYNIADTEPLSTNSLIRAIAAELGIKPRIFSPPKSLIIFFAKFGDLFRLPFNSERLQKLSDNYVVSNAKLLTALQIPLPVQAMDGMTTTLHSFRGDSKII